MLKAWGIVRSGLGTFPMAKEREETSLGAAVGRLSGNLSLNPSSGNCSHWDLTERQTSSKLTFPPLQNETHNLSQSCGGNIQEA